MNLPVPTITFLIELVFEEALTAPTASQVWALKEYAIDLLMYYHHVTGTVHEMDKRLDELSERIILLTSE